jgi:superfamily II DNA or RNA helicase
MENPNVHVLLLTATPVRSTPWNMHTLLVLAKLVKPDTWKKYREIYFALTYKPFLARPAWLPVKGWQKKMQNLINKYTITALMSDMVDLPSETHEVINIKAPDYEVNEEWEPMAQFVADHRLEQLSKVATIREIAKGYRKVVVVAHYTDQIRSLEKELSRERAVFTLDGSTKNPGKTIADAEESPECYFIIQASVGAGFELPSFAVMVFASQGYSVRNWTQMIGRIKRINSLKPTKFYYLLGGRCDKMIYEAIKKGKDFVPSQYLRPTKKG